MYPIYLKTSWLFIFENALNGVKKRFKGLTNQNIGALWLRLGGVQVRVLTGVIVLCTWVRHYSLSASLHPGEEVCTEELSGKPDEMLEVAFDELASHPGGVAILSCGQLGS